MAQNETFLASVFWHKGNPLLHSLVDREVFLDVSIEDVGAPQYAVRSKERAPHFGAPGTYQTD